jgi:DtxR family Mn-dependent transcriptional regulator
MVRKAVEDYVKATLELSETRRRVSTSALAEHLGVKPSSVTMMMKKLSRERPRLVDHESHRGFRLTKAGTRIALDVVRRHRLIEQFLVTVLDFGWDEVHDEAHRLEHCVTPEFINRVDRHLGFPELDPHGRPIPKRDGRLIAPVERPLSEAQVGDVVRVSSVHSEEVKFLRYLTQVGLVLDASVKVLETLSVGGVMRVEVGSGRRGKSQVISESIATSIFVTRKGG